MLSFLIAWCGICKQVDIHSERRKTRLSNYNVRVRSPPRLFISSRGPVVVPLRISNLTVSRLRYSRNGILPLNHVLVLSWSSRRSHHLRRNLSRVLPAGKRMAQSRPCTRRTEPPRSEQGRLGPRRRGECERLQHEGEHAGGFQHWRRIGSD